MKKINLKPMPTFGKAQAVVFSTSPEWATRETLKQVPMPVVRRGADDHKKYASKSI